MAAEPPAAGGPLSTLGGALRAARRRLEAAGVDTAALDARLLVEQFSGRSREDVLLRPDLPLGAPEAESIAAAVGRREGGEPVHRILGWREFFGLRLGLSPATLEPRPDTETLVEAVLPFVRRMAEREGACRLLDLGTGTGAVALALLAAEPRARAVGVDLSAEALSTARENARALGLGDRFETRRSDWLMDVSGRHHWIVSNPPYISESEMRALPVEVARFDPRLSLSGGADGLDAYRTIARDADAFLEPGGGVAVEIGAAQREAVTALFAAQGFTLLEAARDLGGRDRVLVFGRQEASDD